VAIHWTYKDDPSSYLEQGDLLKKTEYIIQLLNQYHPHYATHPANQFFIVLTQSCDLVTRGGSCKSEYVALAPVRPLRIVLEREFSDSLRNRVPKGQPFASNSTRERYEDILTKIFNNNYAKYFYLEKQPERGLSEDMCAVLPLSISIKSEHYQECLKARFLQLDDAFQSKLGYLVGQQYAKVGTKDWDESAIKAKVESVVTGMAVWVNDSDVGTLMRTVSEFEAANPGAPVDSANLAEMISKIPTKKQQAIDATLEFLVSQKLLPEGRSPERMKVRKALTSDTGFAKFFRNS
jgi:hypothetical protein